MFPSPIRISAIAILLFISTGAIAQPDTDGQLWKRHITHKVSIGSQETGKHKAKTKSLLEKLIPEIKAGRITAYQGSMPGLTSALTIQDFSKIFEPRTDTLTAIDPISGEAVYRVTTADFDLNWVQRYNLVEEWTFDRHTGKTEIYILGIGPMADVLNDDGTIRGHQTMFWVRYNEAASLLKNDDYNNPDHSLLSCIWGDNATTANEKHIKPNEPVWEETRSHLVLLSPTDDTTKYLGIGYGDNDDTSLSKGLMLAVKEGRITMYAEADSICTVPISPEKARENLKVMRTDTTQVWDPVTAQTVWKVTTYEDELYDDAIHDYKVTEHKTFDYNTGIITFNIIGVAFSFYRQSPFWLRYSDIQPILSKYEQYHPQYSFYTALWNSYVSDMEENYKAHLANIAR